MARRAVTPTSLAFLDVMFCGFGAVVLLVVILNGDVLQKREEHSRDLRAELQRITALEEFARQHLEETRQQIETVELQQGDLGIQAERLEAKVQETSRQARQAEERSRSLQDSIRTAEAQRAALEQTTRLLRSKAAEKWEGGDKPVGFTGDGQRQYLTGLKLGAERTLILLDSSASMLDETVVNVVRRKLMNPATRQAAPKWQRALRTLHWLIANLRPGKEFQVYRFDTQASPLIGGTGGNWLSTDNAGQLTSAISESRKIAPIGGTSLHKAFAAIRALDRKPDSVILITDGLPTQGNRKRKNALVSAGERLQLFLEAQKLIPGNVPINTLLFPMEGDPVAAGAFWTLAIETKGSFITPSRDWP